MKYNSFDNSLLRISAVALGTWVFAGELWGGAKEQDCIAAVLAAKDAGINLIDTAPIYGHGRSETIIGKALKGIRKNMVIATKCGLLKQSRKIVHNLSPGSIRNEIEASLKRLQTDYIDIYQCHWPDPDTPIEDTLEELGRLKQQGKIRFVGVSNFELSLLQKAIVSADIVTLQSQFSMLDRSLEEDILPCIREQGVGLMSYGTLAGGILSGKYLEPPRFRGPDVRKFFYQYYTGGAFEKVQRLLDGLRTIDKPLNQIAINWVRQQRGVLCVIAGCRNAKQVESNAMAVDWDLSAQEMQTIDALLH